MLTPRQFLIFQRAMERFAEPAVFANLRDNPHHSFVKEASWRTGDGDLPSVAEVREVETLVTRIIEADDQREDEG